jgi:hypothetical protein
MLMQRATMEDEPMYLEALRIMTALQYGNGQEMYFSI